MMEFVAVMIFALYVLVGLTRPLDVLHSDSSREARADLVGKHGSGKKHNTRRSDQKQQTKNNKRYNIVQNEIKKRKQQTK